MCVTDSNSGTHAERIYIAGPYSADTEIDILDNVYDAIWAGVIIHQRGHVPFIPHLTYYMDKIAKAMNETITYQQYLNMDIAWLRQCNSLLFLGSSPGADKELELAKSLGMKIYQSTDEIPNLLDHTPFLVVGTGACRCK